MRFVRPISIVLILIAVTVGTLSDAPHSHPPTFLGGYRVLTADFHVHSFPMSWGTLAPWDTVLEAGHDGLDVIAMTPHNHVWVAYVGRWFSEHFGGPAVLIGEEIVTPRYHLLGIGIHDAIDWRQSAANAIDEVHRQGGIAIAAHPRRFYWPAYDSAALSKLDARRFSIRSSTPPLADTERFSIFSHKHNLRPSAILIITAPDRWEFAEPLFLRAMIPKARFLTRFAHITRLQWTAMGEPMVIRRSLRWRKAWI